jgi:hypothetical protein
VRSTLTCRQSPRLPAEALAQTENGGYTSQKNPPYIFGLCRSRSLPKAMAWDARRFFFLKKKTTPATVETTSCRKPKK